MSAGGCSPGRAAEEPALCTIRAEQQRSYGRRRDAAPLWMGNLCFRVQGRPAGGAQAPTHSVCGEVWIILLSARTLPISLTIIAKKV